MLNSEDFESATRELTAAAICDGSHLTHQYYSNPFFVRVLLSKATDGESSHRITKCDSDLQMVTIGRLKHLLRQYKNLDTYRMKLIHLISKETEAMGIPSGVGKRVFDLTSSSNLSGKGALPTTTCRRIRKRQHVFKVDERDKIEKYISALRKRYTALHEAEAHYQCEKARECDRLESVAKECRSKFTKDENTREEKAKNLLEDLDKELLKAIPMLSHLEDTAMSLFAHGKVNQQVLENIKTTVHAEINAILATPNDCLREEAQHKVSVNAAAERCGKQHRDQSWQRPRSLTQDSLYYSILNEYGARTTAARDMQGINDDVDTDVEHIDRNRVFIELRKRHREVLLKAAQLSAPLCPYEFILKE